MKKRPVWIPTAQLFFAIALVFVILFDIQDCRRIMGLDIFSPELKREVFFDHLFQWLMWGLLIVTNLFSAVVWNWPQEKIGFGSTVVLTAMIPAWGATGLIPGFAASRPVLWWFLLLVILAGALHGWWKHSKHKNDEVSSS